MRNFLRGILYSAVIAGAALIGSAQAAIIGSGSVSMAGGFTPTGGPNIASATGVHFLPAGAGNVVVTNGGGTGGFASLTTGTTGSIHDFAFKPFTPQAAFLTIGAFTFDLNTISIESQNANFLNLHGVATVHAAGFDTTQASFDFSGQGGGAPATFSWSATSTAAAVPEPMTVGLLGIGLAAFGFMRRRAEEI
jgi:hypothetical protein